jgi:hypothetical protein
MKFQLIMHDGVDNNEGDNNHNVENRKRRAFDDIPGDFVRVQSAGVPDKSNNGNVVCSCPVCGGQFYSNAAFAAHLPCRGG